MRLQLGYPNAASYRLAVRKEIARADEKAYAQESGEASGAAGEEAPDGAQSQCILRRGFSESAARLAMDVGVADPLADIPERETEAPRGADDGGSAGIKVKKGIVVHTLEPAPSASFTVTHSSLRDRG